MTASREKGLWICFIGYVLYVDAWLKRSGNNLHPDDRHLTVQHRHPDSSSIGIVKAQLHKWSHLQEGSEHTASKYSEKIMSPECRKFIWIKRWALKGQTLSNLCSLSKCHCFHSTDYKVEAWRSQRNFSEDWNPLAQAHSLQNILACGQSEKGMTVGASHVSKALWKNQYKMVQNQQF